MDRSDSDLPRLARLQALLLDLLAADLPLAEIPDLLRPHATDPATRAWIAAFDPVMLATARELVRRWGRR